MMKTKFLLFILLVGSTKLLAQIGFDENIIIGNSYTTYSPQYVKAVDIDGDGDLDVVANGRELNWYENIDGLGNFGEKKTIAGTLTGSIGNSLSVVDFDNDGDPDLLGATNNTFTTYRNTDGLGHFQVVQSLTVGNNNSTPMSLMSTDMDGDGDSDILCVYPTSLSRFLVWYPNNGTGTFGTEQVITSGDSIAVTSSVQTADLDGDNKQDIVLGSNGYGRISWLKNNGNGTYSAPVIITSSASGVASIVASDFDHDGDLDIVAATAYNNKLALYKNLDGLGTFGAENLLLSFTTASYAVFVADINNDNNQDILYTSTNEIGWLNNNGAAVFGPQQVITNKAYGVRAVTMADLDGDGKNDLISASTDDEKVAWYKNIDNNGNFGRQLVIGRSIQFPNKVYPGDFDGDQDIDLLVSSQHDAKLAWFENVNGIGFYGKEHIITESVTVGNITPKAYPVDIDGDGDLDIATIKDSILFWYENDGQGNFTVEHVIDSTSDATLVQAADMDGDGDADVVCGTYNSAKMAWYKNLGSGVFGTELIFSPADGTNSGLTSLEIADMDGDNDMDIIASDFDWDMYYFKNTNGLGNFVLQNLTVFAREYAVYPADMDGDGDNDIIGITLSGGSSSYAGVAWFENSNGAFNVSHDISAVAVGGKSVKAADIDHDGDLDVITGEGTRLAWYANNGNGTFGARQVIQQMNDYTEAICVATADVDHDNDLDVLGVFGYNANWIIGKVSVYENLGDLGNDIHGTVLIDSNSNGCTSDDFKGGNMMVVADNGSHSFATFTDDQGAYHIATTAGNFTAEITSELPNYFVATPASYAINFSGLNNTQTANFCVAPVSQVNDLEVSLYAVRDIRPGFPAYYRMVYKNVGTTTLSGTVNFEYNNNKINFLTASETIASQTANTLTFDFADLHPFETRTININCTVFSPPVTNINDQIVSHVTINSVSGDQTEDNNSHTLSQTVIGSHDPNDISCLEGNQVLIADADKYLHYIIRFQNTGTASAINVHVENALDGKLDWTTLQLESLSHNGRTELNDGSDLKFIFDNINLHDSTTDEAHSHGFIAYKIKPKANVVVGDIVNNTANIFFDFNPPVVTNTAATRFVNVLGVAQNEARQFSLYPNPTTGLLNIQGSAMMEQVSVTDINGRILKTFRFDTPALSAQVDLADLTSGVYFLKIKSGQGTSNSKIIKR